MRETMKYDEARVIISRWDHELLKHLAKRSRRSAREVVSAMLEDAGVVWGLLRADQRSTAPLRPADSWSAEEWREHAAMWERLAETCMRRIEELRAALSEECARSADLARRVEELTPRKARGWVPPWSDRS